MDKNSRDRGGRDGREERMLHSPLKKRDRGDRRTESDRSTSSESDHHNRYSSNERNQPTTRGRNYHDSRERDRDSRDRGRSYNRSETYRPATSGRHERNYHNPRERDGDSRDRGRSYNRSETYRPAASGRDERNYHNPRGRDRDSRDRGRMYSRTETDRPTASGRDDHERYSRGERYNHDLRKRDRDSRDRGGRHSIHERGPPHDRIRLSPTAPGDRDREREYEQKSDASPTLYCDQSDLLPPFKRFRRDDGRYNKARKLSELFLRDLKRGKVHTSPGVDSMTTDISAAPKVPFIDSERTKVHIKQAQALIRKLGHEKGIEDNILYNDGSMSIKIKGPGSFVFLEERTLLDTLLTYLWRVHGLDYYGMTETDEAHGFRHVIGDGGKDNVPDLFELAWMDKLEQYWGMRLKSKDLEKLQLSPLKMPKRDDGRPDKFEMDVCRYCKISGHTLIDCPEIPKPQSTNITDHGLIVENLPPEADEIGVLEHFRKVGQVVRLFLMRNEKNNKCSGKALLYYIYKYEAERAIQRYNNTFYQNAHFQMRVKWRKPEA